MQIIKPSRLSGITLNASMQALLGPKAQSCLDAGLPAPKKLLNHLQKGLRWEEQRLIYRYTRHTLPGESRTSFEFFSSKTYLLDFCFEEDKDAPLSCRVRQGITYALKLSEFISQYSAFFTIYVFGHPKDEWSTHDDCSIQFHLNRVGEGSPLLTADILHPNFANPALILQFGP